MCMKCQILFSVKNKKTISKCLLNVYPACSALCCMEAKAKSGTSNFGERTCQTFIFVALIIKAECLSCFKDGEFIFMDFCFK